MTRRIVRRPSDVIPSYLSHRPSIRTVLRSFLLTFDAFTLVRTMRPTYHYLPLLYSCLIIRYTRPIILCYFDRLFGRSFD
jgi:hypothetical protein